MTLLAQLLVKPVVLFGVLKIYQTTAIADSNRKIQRKKLIQIKIH